MPGVRDVQVTRRDHVRAAGDEGFHRHPGPSHQVRFQVPLRQVERVMGHDDARDLIGQRAQALPHPRHLALVDPTSLEGQRSGRVDAGDRDLVVAEEGLEVVRDVAPVVRERVGKAERDVVQRDVVIAGDDDLRLRQRREEVARFPELSAPRPLGEVPRDEDDIGPDLFRRRQERRERGRIGPAEVQVREVEERPHDAFRPSVSRGTTTRSAPGSER